MRYFIFISLVFFRIELKAQDIILNLNSEVEGRLAEIFNPPRACHLASVEETAPELEVADLGLNPYVQCLESMCGPSDRANTYNDIQLSIQDRSPNPAIERALNSLAERIRVSINRTNANYVQDMDFLRRNLLNENFGLNSAANRFLMMNRALASIPYDYLFDENFIRYDNENLGIRSSRISDREGLRNILSDKFSGTMLELMTDTIIAILGLPAMQQYIYQSMYGSAISINNSYPGLTFQEITSRMDSEIGSIFQRLATQLNLNPELQNHIIPPGIRSISQNPNLISDSTVSELLDLQMSLELFSAGIETLPASLLTRIDNLQLTAQDRNELIQKIDEQKTLATNFNQANADEIDSVIEQCQQAYLHSYNAMPTQREIQAFRTKIDRLKTQIEERFLNRFSQRSREGLVQAINNLPIVFPPQQNNFQEYFDIMIEAKFDREWSGRSSNINIESLDQASQSIMNSSVMSSVYDNKGLSDLSLLAEVCGEMPYFDGVNDVASILPVGGIIVSWPTIKAGDPGLGTVAHEIGHSIEGHFRNNTTSEASVHEFQVMRQCLSSQQPDEVNTIERNCNFHGRDGVETMQWNESVYTQEDFADFVESQVTSGNSACLLLNNENGYQDRNVFENYAENNDTHSPVLQRTMRVHHLQNGRLPEQCVQTLASQGVVLNLSSCSTSSTAASQ